MKKKNACLGRFEGKVGMAKYGVMQGNFQAFSMGRKVSRRKERGCKSTPFRFTADGKADRKAILLLLKAMNHRGCKTA